MRAAIAALLGMLAFAAPAAADTYCVTPATGCDHTASSIQDGLNQAATHAGDDVVQLGSMTYSLDLATTPLTYPLSGQGTVTLKGLGPTHTTITSPVAIAPGNAAIGGTYLGAGAGVMNVSDLQISVTGSGGGPETDGAAIATRGTLFQNLQIDLQSNGNIGLFFEGGGAVTVRNVTFISSVVAPNFSTCIEAVPGGPSPPTALTLVDIVDSDCQLELEHPNVNATIERAKITSQVGLVAGGGPGTVKIENSTISTSGTAIHAINFADLLISHSTIVGAGTGTGVFADNQGVTSLTKVQLFDSIVRGFTLADGLRMNSSSSPSHPASLTGDYDAYDTPFTTLPGSTFSIPHFINNTDPLFTTPPSDLSLLAGSPMLDQDPAPLGTNFPGESPTDLAGNARITGGKRDLGAYERPAQPTATTADATAVTQTGATLSGTANEGGAVGGGTAQLVYGPTAAHGTPVPPLPLAVSGDGVAVSSPITGLAPGTTYHFALVVHSSLGTVTSADRTFTTEATPPGGGAPGGNTPPPGGNTGNPETTTPVIGSLSLSPSRFKAARSGSTLATPPKKRAAGGATLTVSLNVAATVTFTVTRQDRGIRRGKTCVARGHGRHGKACTRAVKLRGSTSKSLKAGTTKLRFSARVSSHLLKPAVYVLTATPRGGKAKTVKFTVTR
jgi:hypothetical protein